MKPRRGHYRGLINVEGVYPGGILRSGVVETHDPLGEGVRALRRCPPQDLQEARHPEPAAGMVGEEGRGQDGQANSAAKSEGWDIGQNYDRGWRTSARARVDRDRT